MPIQMCAYGSPQAHAQPQLHFHKERLERTGHGRPALLHLLHGTAAKHLGAKLLVAVQRLEQRVEVARGSLIYQAAVGAKVRGARRNAACKRVR